MPAKQLWVPVWHRVCRFVTALDAAIMPLRCVFCGLDVQADERHVCAGCNAELPRLLHPCPRCGEALPSADAAKAQCADCQVKPPPFEAAIAPFAYEYPIDAAIKMFKFRRRLFYAPAFGELMLPALAKLPEDIDALLPVPLYWLRQGVRGFNQATEICEALRRATGLPIVKTVRRVRATPYQSGSSARERRRNLRNAFAIRGCVEAGHVLIVDDVITTGETCRQLALLLKAHGVAKVSVLALARA